MSAAGNVQGISLYNNSFKADSKTPYIIPSQSKTMHDDFVARQKKDERKKNISLGVNAALAAAFVTIAATTVYSLVKGTVRTPKTIFKKIGDMPALTDDCINPEVKDFITKVKEILNVPQNLIERTGVKRPRMVLFYGPTGTGKTFSAKLLAKEMGAEYGEVQFSDLSSPYVGETAVKISNKFKEFIKIAKKNPNKQYVVAFNEIDSLINNVEKLGANNVHLGQNRTSFLNGLDAVKDIPNLTIVGTTNINPNTANLDPATLSRLGDIYEIKCPNKKEIVASLKYHLKKSKAADNLIKDDTALGELAESIYNKKGAQRDVENIVDTALANFTAKISKESDCMSKQIEKKYLQDVINSRTTWAASIDASDSCSGIEETFINNIIKFISRLGSDNGSGAGA